MGLWILAGIVVLLMLAVVVVALLYGRADETVRPEVPDWTLPSPRDLAEPRFPLAWQGYDPDHVDAWVEGVRRAQEELWNALGPSGVAELHERLARADQGSGRDGHEGVVPSPDLLATAPPRRVEPNAGTGEIVTPPVADDVPPPRPTERTSPTDDEPLFLRDPAEPPPTVLPKVRADDDGNDRD